MVASIVWTGERLKMVMDLHWEWKRNIIGTYLTGVLPKYTVNPIPSHTPKTKPGINRRTITYSHTYYRISSYSQYRTGRGLVHPRTSAGWTSAWPWRESLPWLSHHSIALESTELWRVRFQRWRFLKVIRSSRVGFKWSVLTELCGRSLRLRGLIFLPTNRVVNNTAQLHKPPVPTSQPGPSSQVTHKPAAWDSARFGITREQNSWTENTRPRGQGKQIAEEIGR
ncbi:hypothetical protein ACRALDRAFT_206468 [Sodiomyces alcalophilus JCM 7366]|uniref:uncharacterized protein n=1 Tax=Sodiomyces alcalophilus JCM 7366 TaxID=591952 RepID=UPI0039B4BC58